MEVLRAVRCPETSASDLAELVEKDPAITARLLRIVNAPVAGVRREITSVQHAATLLGFDTVKAIALAFSLLTHHRDGPCGAFDYDRLWSESLARAVAMRHLADRTGNMLPEDALTYGLLGLIGRLALVTVHPERYRQVLNATEAAPWDALSAAEAEMFGVETAMLSALMMRDWGMPNYHAALEYRQYKVKPEELPVPSMATMMQTAGLMAEIMLEDETSRERVAQLSRLALDLELLPEALAEVFDVASKDWQAAADELVLRTRAVPPFETIAASSDEDESR